jgi:hypothetical protein
MPEEAVVTPESQGEPELAPIEVDDLSPTDEELGKGDGAVEPEAAAVEPEKVPVKHVPLPELLEERKKRQALEARVNQDAAQNRILRERLDAILQKIQEAEKPQEPPQPVYEEDPAAYLKWQNDQLLAERRAVAEKRAEEEKQSSQVKQLEQVRQTIKQGINQFAEVTPDYNDAAKYLIEARLKELEVMGVTDQNEIRTRLEQDEIEVGYWALQQGKSPGEVFYNLARSRGYSGTKPVAEKESTLESVRKGQQAATSLSKAGGAPEGEITTETLLAMNDEDFAKYTKGKKWAKLHGR